MSTEQTDPLVMQAATRQLVMEGIRQFASYISEDIRGITQAIPSSERGLKELFTAIGSNVIKYETQQSIQVAARKIGAAADSCTKDVARIADALERIADAQTKERV